MQMSHDKVMQQQKHHQIFPKQHDLLAVLYIAAVRMLVQYLHQTLYFIKS